MSDTCEALSDYKGVEVKCFKRKGHKEKDRDSHEGIVRINDEYQGTITWQ